MSKLHTVIVKPLETEKSATQNAGKTTFIVRRDATKTEIAEAVKKYYGTDVKSVHTSVIAPKTRTVGRGKIIIKRPLQKKAIVTMKNGKAIDFNKIKVNA